MKQRQDGVWVDLQRGDILGPPAMPDVSPPMEIVTVGDGPEVPLLGFATGGSRARAHVGSMFRGIYTPGPGRGDYTPEQQVRMRNFVSIVEPSGWKISLGSWSEDETPKAVETARP